jgi:serine protease inhibitor
VELPALAASILLVLPSVKTSIAELEGMLAKKPDLVESMLTPNLGNVTLPLVHFAVEKDLKPQLKELGVRRVFETFDSLRPLALPRSGLL